MGLIDARIAVILDGTATSDGQSKLVSHPGSGIAQPLIVTLAVRLQVATPKAA